MSLYQQVEEKIRKYFASLLDGRLMIEALKTAAGWDDENRAAEQVGTLIYRVRRGGVIYENILNSLVEWAEANGYGVEDFGVRHKIEANNWTKELTLWIYVELSNKRFVSWPITSVIDTSNMPKEQFEELKAEIAAVRAVLEAAKIYCKR